jgi:hypothetical protein
MSTEMTKVSPRTVVIELHGGIAYEKDGLPDVSIELHDYDVNDDAARP